MSEPSNPERFYVDEPGVWRGRQDEVVDAEVLSAPPALTPESVPTRRVNPEDPHWMGGPAARSAEAKRQGATGATPIRAGGKPIPPEQTEPEASGGRHVPLAVKLLLPSIWVLIIVVVTAMVLPKSSPKTHLGNAVSLPGTLLGQPLMQGSEGSLVTEEASGLTIPGLKGGAWGKDPSKPEYLVLVASGSGVETATYAAQFEAVNLLKYAGAQFVPAGLQRCALIAGAPAPVSVCVWHDERSFGAVYLFGHTVPMEAGLGVKVQTQVEGGK